MNDCRPGKLIWLCVLWLSAVLSVSASAQDVGRYERSIVPFLKTHCFACHTGDQPEAGLDLNRLPPDFSSDQTAGQWVGVMHALQFGEMPPPEENQPDPLRTAEVSEWVLEQMAESGRFDAYQKKLLAPEYGNWVSHERLFSGAIKTPPFSPARLWRFSPEIFKNKGFSNARSPYTYVTPETEIRDYSAMSGVDQSTVQMVLLAADTFIEYREHRGEFERFENDETADQDKLFNETVEREYRRIVGQSPDGDERTRYAAFLKKNVEIGGRLDGLKTTLRAMFLSPEAIYRMEFGLGDSDEHGRRLLSPDEVSYSLAFALTERSPEQTPQIRDALRNGKLGRKEDVARVVEQLLDEHLDSYNTTWDWEWRRHRLAHLLRFFEEYFGFHHAGTVFKDNDRRRREGIRQWNTNMLVHDVRMLIEHHLRRDKDVIAELLTTNEYFIAHPGDNEYAREFYDQKIAEMTQSDYVKQRVAKRRQQLEKEQREFQIPQQEFENRLAGEQKTAERIVRRFDVALDEGIRPHPGFPFSERSHGIADLLYIDAYNLPASGSADDQKWNWPIEQPLTMPSDLRAGILTHPAWLAAHSLNDGNDPIHRGIWIRTKLLAGVIQDVPPDVDANVGNDPHKTLRERMEKLRDERCWRCHRKMNPLGEPFELFDDWGRSRTHVYFDENNEIVTRRDGVFDRALKEGKYSEREIDAAGHVSGTGDPEVDGDVENAVEMMRRIGQSDRARQSFIRHLFRYLMGRNEMLSDSRTLIDAENAYLNNGGSFRALVVSLLTSDSFMYRR